MFQNLVFTEERSIIDPQEVAELLTFKGRLKKNSPLQLSASEMALHLLGNNLSRISPRQAEALLNAARPAMDRHRQLREHAVSGHPFRNEFIPTSTDDEFLRRCDLAMERMRPMQGVTLEALDSESHAQRRLIENLDNFCRLPSELREHFKSAAEAAFSHAFAVRDPSDEFMRDFRDLVLRLEASADPSPSTASRITQRTVATSTQAPETVVNSDSASQEVLPIHQRISRFLKRLVGRDPQAKKVTPVPVRLMETLTREQGATAFEILQQNEPAIEALLMRHELNLRSRTAHQNPTALSNGAGVRVAENNPDAPATSEAIAYDELSDETRPALRTATQSHCIGESLNRSVNK